MIHACALTCLAGALDPPAEHGAGGLNTVGLGVT